MLHWNTEATSLYGTDKDVIYGKGAHYDTMRTTPGISPLRKSPTLLLALAQCCTTCKKHCVFPVNYQSEDWIAYKIFSLSIFS